MYPMGYGPSKLFIEEVSPSENFFRLCAVTWRFSLRFSLVSKVLPKKNMQITQGSLNGTHFRGSNNTNL